MPWRSLRSKREVPVVALAIMSCLTARALLHRSAGLSFGLPWPKRQELDSRSAQKLIDSVEAFVFDLDGVLWVGDYIIPGAVKALSDLRSAGKAIVFATNNSMRKRADTVEKLRKGGLHWVVEGDVFNAGNAAARLLESKGISKDKKIYIVGEAGLRDEVSALGYETSGGPDDQGKTTKDAEADLEHMDLSSFGAVVCGLDQHINYYKLTIASYLVRNGCPLYASNMDCYFGKVGTSKQQYPAAASILMAVATAAGRQPPSADALGGKPSMEFAQRVQESLGFPYHKMVMVGDRLDMDIAFGNSAGMQTLLVLSGETTRDDLKSASGKSVPDFVAESVSVLGFES